METPIALPSSPGAREISWVMDSAVSRSMSPFTLTEQVYEWPGQRWAVVMKLPAMSQADALAWQAFFADINGAAGTFWIPESTFLHTAETDFGTPELAGDHTAGPSVNTRGWNANQLVLTKGQKIEIGGRIRQVVADVYSDETGLAVVKCWPHCRDLSDELPVIWYQPKGVFRARSVPEFNWQTNRLQAGFQFSADEVILP